MWDIQDHRGILEYPAIVGKLELIRHPATQDTQEDQVTVGIILEVLVTQDTQASQVTRGIQE